MNAVADIGPYEKDIIAQLGCYPQDAAMVEDIMRRFVFHRAEQRRTGPWCTGGMGHAGGGPGDV